MLPFLFLLILVVLVLAIVALSQIGSLRWDIRNLNDRIRRLDRKIADLAKRTRAPEAKDEAATDGTPAGERPPEAVRRRPVRPVRHVASTERAPEKPEKGDRVAAQSGPAAESPSRGQESLSQPTEDRKAPKPEPASVPGGGDTEERAERTAARAAMSGTPGKGERKTGKEAGTGAKEEEPTSDKGLGFEAKLGTVWAMRIGLVLLAIAAAYTARTYVPSLAPVWKVVLAYACCAVLFAVGKVSERRLSAFAKPVMAGGLALGFFVSYAAYFVTPMRAVSLPVSLVWMAAGVVAILVFAERWRSQQTAALAIVLGHLSAFVAAGSDDRFSLIMITALSIIAVVLLIRNNWVELTLFAVVTAYGSHILWSLADHVQTTAERQFWVNIAFFASYYVAFLVADLVWWRRLTKQADWECRRFQGLSGRLIGPVNVTLFLFVTASLYVVTDVYLTDIYWFFFLLAAIQEVHGRYLKILGNDDYVFYSAVGTILVALGFFSAFEALSLSVALAAEALVLLILAHRTRVWLFHVLAQIALVVNFVHSWWYEVGAAPSATMFAGAAAVFGVYMVMSWLEDRWYGRDGDPDWDVPAFSDKLPFGSVSRLLAEQFDDVYSAVTPYLSFLHAGAGALILIQQADRLLEVPFALLTLAVAVLLLLSVALWLRNLPFLVGCLVLQFGIAYIGYTGNPGPYWIFWAVLTAGFIGALVLVTLAPSRMREISDKKMAILMSHGLVWGVLVAMPWAIFHVSWEGALGFAWIATIGLLFWHQDRVSASVGKLEEQSDSTILLDRLSGMIACVIGAIMIVFWTALIAEGWDASPDFVVPSLLMLWVGILVTVAGLRSRIRLYVGGFAVLLICYMMITSLYHELPNNIWASLWVVAVTCVIAVAQDYRLNSKLPKAEFRQPLIVATYVVYAMGFGLLFAFFGALIGFPWSVVAMAILPFALMALVWKLGTERAAWVAIATILGLHVGVWVGLFGNFAVESNEFLLPVSLLFVLTVGMERILTTETRLPLMADFSDPNPNVRLLLIVSMVAVAIVVVYESTLITGGWTNATWSLVGAVLMVLGFLWKSARYRRVALAVFAVCLIRLAVDDIWDLTDGQRVLAFAALGGCLLAVAWLYSRFADQFKKWL